MRACAFVLFHLVSLNVRTYAFVSLKDEHNGNGTRSKNGTGIRTRETVQPQVQPWNRKTVQPRDAQK